MKIIIIAAILMLSITPLPASAVDIEGQLMNLNNDVHAIRKNAENAELVKDYAQGVYADMNVNRMREVCKNKGKYEVVRMGVADAEHPDPMYNVKDVSCWED